MDALIPILLFSTWMGPGIILAPGSTQADSLVRAASPVRTPGSVQTDSLWVLELEVDPSQIQAGMFFSGATVSVSAILPEDAGVAIACVGNDEPVVMNRKGKVLGLIWMNVEEVEFNDTPTLYQLNTSKDYEQLAAPPALQALGVGYGSLEARAGTVGSGASEAELFNELIRLKESEGLFAASEGAVRTSPAGTGRTRVTTDFHLPAKTPPGLYRILVYGFSEGEGALLARGEVRLTQMGAASLISTLAMNHGLLYGVLAVVVAVSVGLLTGMVFGLGSKKAH